MPTPFETIWARICALEGSEFATKTGKSFTYTIEGDAFFPSQTRYRIAKSDFEKALAAGSLNGPGDISKLVRGPSYVWAVLQDDRVRPETD